MMPFTFSEAAANLITNEALDPFGKIPEFKFCAVSLKKEILWKQSVYLELNADSTYLRKDIVNIVFFLIQN